MLFNLSYFIDQLLRLLQILANSWTLLVLYFSIIFRKNLESLLVVLAGKVANSNKLGFGSISIEQPSISTEETNTINNLNELISVKEREIDEQESNGKAYVSQLHNQINFLTRLALVYEFKYLDKILVPNTKVFLADIEAGLNTTRLSKQQFFADHEQDMQEKNAIVQALKLNELTKYVSGYAEVTEKGKEFLKFISDKEKYILEFYNSFSK